MNNKILGNYIKTINYDLISNQVSGSQISGSQISSSQISGSQVTGSQITNDFKIVDVPFEQYIIKVRLSSANEFMGIVGISIKKDFISLQEKIAYESSKIYYDVDKFYDELEAE